MNINEAKRILKSAGYLMERLNMNEVVGELYSLVSDNAVTEMEMVDPHVADVYVTPSQLEALPVFPEWMKLMGQKRKMTITKGLGDEDLRCLDFGPRQKIKGLLDHNIRVWKVELEF